MQETKDPTIRLFGKKIQLPANGEIPAISGYDSLVAFGSTVVALEDNSSDQDRTSEEDEKASCRVGVVLEEQEADEDSLAENPTEINKPQDNAPLPATKESTKPETSSETNANPKTPSIDKETATLIKTPKTEKELNDTTNSQEKTLKKPDKILPCPRCNSMDTKFCYYNNYNVNQPRHFCKNCQRYWTAGGTMRNVPVGAGRRKNKNTSTHYRHITVSEALQAAQIDAPNGIHHPSLKTNGTVLAFGSDAPLCESMSSVLNLAEKRALNGTLNGFHKLERGIPVPCKGGGENGDDRSSGSSVTASNLTEEGVRNGPQEPMMRNLHGFPSQIPCLPGVPWPYSWNSAVPLPAFCPPGFPMPFYPAPYWSGTIPGAWNMPWLPPPSSFTNQKAPSSGPNSPTLGKHSRDGNMLEPRNPEEVEPPQQNSERCIWVPKTLRIDDPDEAARSSIWATLGIKNDKADSIGGVGLFKAFQSKRDEKNHIAETSPVLWANPAALSRSLNFQESS